MLPLLLLLLDAPAPPVAAVRAINLDRLTVAQPQHLAGKRLRFRAELDGQQCYDCRCKDRLVNDAGGRTDRPGDIEAARPTAEGTFTGFSPPA
jgi:hypothetical protein